MNLLRKMLFSIGAVFLFIGVTLAQDFYFYKQKVDSFDKASHWEATGSNQGPGTKLNYVSKPTIAGLGALELNYDFTGVANALNYCEYSRRIQLPDETASLSFWVHSDGSGHAIRFRLVDKSGETLQYTVDNLTWQGWREVSVDLAKPNGYWGGDGDGLPTHPVFFHSLLVDSKAKDFVGRGRIFVDELTAAIAVPAQESVILEVESGKAGHIFTSSEQMVFNLNFINLSDVKRELEVSYWVESTHMRSIASGSLEVIVAQGATQTKQLTLPVRANGTYLLKLYLRSRDRVVRLQKIIPFSRVLPLLEHRKEGIFGVCTHFAQNKGDIEKNLNLAALSGAGWIRDEMYWNAAEKVKGKIEILPQWDQYIDAALAKGLQPLLILSYGNPFYDDGQAPHTPEGIAAFVRYAETLACHFKGRIKHYELWNEWDIAAGSKKRPPSPEEYAVLLQAVYPAIKAIDPEAVVIAGATAGGGVNLPWTERMLKVAGVENMDAFSIHPYSYPQSPERGGLVRDLEAMRDLFLRYGGTRPLWITEIGWPNQDDNRGVSERLSGAYAVRSHVEAMTTGLVERIFWYDLQNDGIDLKYNEDNFGMLLCWQGEEVPWAAKDNYLAYNTMANKLLGAQFVRTYDFGPQLRVYHFTNKDGKDLIVAWTLNGTTTVGLNLGSDSAICTDLFGNSFLLSGFDDVFSVTLSDYPLYFEGEFAEVQLLQSALSPELPILSVVAGETAPVNFVLPEGLSGQFLADLPSSWQLVGDTSFTAKQLQLKVSMGAIKESYELVFYPISGQNILGRLIVQAQIVEPIDLEVIAIPSLQGDWEKWQLNINVNNYTTSQVLSGSMAVREPASWAAALRPVTFSKVAPGEGTILTLPVPSLPKESLVNLVLDLNLAGGYSTTITQQVNFLAVTRTKREPIIDGNLDEWTDAMPFFVDQKEQVQLIEDWGGKTDLSGRGYLMWDQDYLYLALEVTDNQHYQIWADGDTWQGDGIQLAIDPGRSKEPGSLGYNELGFALSEKRVENWRWQAPFGLSVGKLDNCQAAIVRRGINTIYELALPWQELLPAGMEAQSGLVLGFSFLVNDNDGNGRRGWIEYMSGIGLGKDPFSFGDIILVD